MYNNIVSLLHFTVFSNFVVSMEPNLRLCRDPKIKRIPDPSNCGQFFDCIAGVFMPCPHSLAFHPTLQLCDFPIYVKGCENYERETYNEFGKFFLNSSCY